MNSYGFDFRQICKLSDVEVELDRHYKFKNVDFLVKPRRSAKTLLVTFHGISRGTDNHTVIPIFRGYNWQFPGASLLCISDRLLEIYRQRLVLTWFLGTRKYDVQSIYEEIVNEVARRLGAEEIVCFGTSGGGHPAIVLAGAINGRCIIANSQIYLHKYGRHLENLNRVVTTDGDNLVGVDIESVLVSKALPARMQIFQNKADTHHYTEHFLPFKEYVTALGLSNAEFIEFDSGVQEGRDPHGDAFPSGSWLGTYL